MTPSETPPVRRVSSATSTRPVAAGLAQDVVGGQRRDPAQVQHPAADAVGGQPGGRPQAHPQPVAERDDGQVARRRRSSAAPADRDMPGGPQRQAGHSGASQPPSPARCRSRVWYRAIGSRNTQTLPSASRGGQAGAQHGRGVVRPGRAGDDQARDVTQAGQRVVVVEVPAEAPLVGEPGDAQHHRVAVLALGEEATAWPPRRGSGPPRCAGRRGTGSPAPGAARPGPRRGPGPRMDCSSSSVSNTRPAPNRSSRPRVTPYTPPLRATSSPNTSMPGRAARASASAALTDWARVSGPPAPRAAARQRRPACGPGRPRGRRPAQTWSGRCGASGAITCAAVASRGAPGHLGGAAEHPWPGTPRTGRAPRRGEHARPLTSSRAVPSSGSRGQVGGDLGRRCGSRVSTSEPAWPPKPDHAQVQERGGAPVADPGRRRPAPCRRPRPGRTPSAWK